MTAVDKSLSQRENNRVTTFPAVPLDELAIRQIIADVDRITTGRRRIDIAHALLRIVAHEIASHATTPAAAKYHGRLVAKDLKAAVREKYDERQRRARTP